jgi:hypothetical protein
MKMMLVVGFLCGLFAVSGLANAANIPLDSDPIALADYSGLISVSQRQGSHRYSFDIAYAVYDTAVYSANGRFDPSGGQDKYIYAYQFFSSINSNTDTKTFTIAIPDGVTVANITYDTTVGVPSGIMPHLENILPNSAIWKFDNDPISPGEHSVVLLFTSSFAPAFNGAASDSGNGHAINGVSVVAPSSVPEPATIAILALGSVLLRKK